MSLRGRYLIDRMKRVISHRFQLPVPPYGNPTYWEGSYKSFGPEDCFEWGDVEFQNLLEYQYESIQWDDNYNNNNNNSTIKKMKRRKKKNNNDERNNPKDNNIMNSSTTTTLITTSFGETLGVHPILHHDGGSEGTNIEGYDNTNDNDRRDDSVVESDDDKKKIKKKKKKEEEQPILILGCGNSKIGEDMLNYGWVGPIIQIDISSSIITKMSERCTTYVSNGSMMLIEDDATELTAFHNGMISSCFDKGLMDALYCADEYKQCISIINNVHRILKPGGIFCFLSYSKPEFWLSNVFLPATTTNNKRMISRKKQQQQQQQHLWEDLQVQQLSSIYLYRFQKTITDPTTSTTTSTIGRDTTKNQKQKRRRQKQKQQKRRTT